MPMKPNVSAESLEIMYKPDIDKGRYLALITDAEEKVGDERETTKQDGSPLTANSYNFKISLGVNIEPDSLKDGWSFPNDPIRYITNANIWVTHVHPGDEEGDWEMIEGARVGSSWKSLCRALGYDYKTDVISPEDMIGRQVLVNVVHEKNETISEEEGVDVYQPAIPFASWAFAPYEEDGEVAPKLEGWKKSEKPKREAF